MTLAFWLALAWMSIGYWHAALRAEDATVALVGARIITMTDAGTFEKGTVLIENGKIVAVGVDVEIPPHAHVIDCSGWTVTPGLIDARSRLWLDEPSANQSGGDASMDAYDGLDRFADDWREVVRQGVTAVYVQPAGGDVCAGVGVVVSTSPADEEAEWILRRDAGLQMALGVGADLSGRGRTRQFDRLKRLLADAKKYQDDWAAYREYERKKQEEAKPVEPPSRPDETAPPETGERGVAESPSSGSGRRLGRGGRGPLPGGARPDTQGVPAQPPTQGQEGQETAETKPSEDAAKPPTKPDHDPIKERLVRVLGGEIPARIDIRHPDEVRRMLELAKEHPGIRWVCEGIVGTGRAAESLRKARYPLVLGPWVGDSLVAREVAEIWRQAFRDDAGRLVIATYANSGRGSRRLRAHAAAAVAAGCDAHLALAAMTRNAAEVLGVGDQVGTIAVGRRADLTVFAGEPLDVSAPVQLTIIGGRIVYENPRRASAAPLVPLPKSSQPLPDTWPGRFALSSTRVLLGNGTFAPRCLTIEDGRIVRCEEGLAADDELPVFDVSGYFVTPGLLLAHTTVGLTSGSYGTVESDARQLAAVDAFDLSHRDVSRMQSGGVLSAIVAPESRWTLAGRMGAVRFGPSGGVVNPDVGEKIVLIGTARRAEQFPASLLGQIELTTSMLAGQTTDTRTYLPKPVRESLLAARVAKRMELLNQQRWVVFEVESDAETVAALELIERFKLRAALLGCRNVEPFIERLLTTRTTLIARPAADTDYSWYYDDLVHAADAGVPILWTASSAQQLRLGVAEAMAAGLDAKQALASMTTQGATWLGFDPQAIGWHVGAPADFVIWDGMPTDLRSRPVRVTSAGGILPEVRE